MLSAHSGLFRAREECFCYSLFSAWWQKCVMKSGLITSANGVVMVTIKNGWVDFHKAKCEGQGHSQGQGQNYIMNHKSVGNYLLYLDNALVLVPSAIFSRYNWLIIIVYFYPKPPVGPSLAFYVFWNVLFEMLVSNNAPDGWYSLTLVPGEPPIRLLLPNIGIFCMEIQLLQTTDLSPTWQRQQA